jgi:hypothetical protein
MIEFVMVIPLIALVIAATFFFAWGLRNRMGVEMSVRFMSWAAVRKVPLPERYGITWHDVIMDHLLMSRTIRHIYYRSFDTYRETDQTPRDLSNYMADYSPEAVPVADKLLMRVWPKGYGFGITRATFPTPSGIWEKLSGEYNGQYIRDSVEWRCGEAANEQELTDEFQRELDEALMAVPAVSRNMAKVFQRLYLSTWSRRN